MDAFYASVEQADNPDLLGKPVAVGGDSDRSVVASASYEARKFGVKSAMPSTIAKKMCPNLFFARPRFSRYKEVSSTIFEIFLKYTPLVEPLSIDEAFLDVTTDTKAICSATLIAKAIKKEIKAVTGLTGSAGISYNKFLAKIASDVNKPDGIFTILPDDADKYIMNMPVEKFHGIGPVTASRMHLLGIHNGADLRGWDMESLIRNFGKAGTFFFNIARGIDDRPVSTEGLRKSVGAELTFDKDLSRNFEIIAELYHVEKELMRRLVKEERSGKTITLKIKYDDFRQITRSKTLPSPVREFTTLHKAVTELRQSVDMEGKRIRLMGVTVSGFSEDESIDDQLHLWNIDNV